MSEEAVAEATLYPGDPIAQSIQDALNAQATPPVENSEEEVVEVPKADEPEKVEEPEKVDEPKEEADKETKPDGDEPEPEAKADFEPTSVDDLKAKWPRAVPLHVIDQAYEWFEEAKAGNEITAKLGEPFIEPLAKMAEVMRSESNDPNDYVPFLEAVVDMAGEDGLAKTLSHSLFVGLVKAPEWADNPAMADFGKEIARRTDFFLEERFGLNAESITALGKLNADVDRLTLAADLDSDGTLDKVLKWIDADTDDLDILDEIEEVRAIRNNPANKKLAQERKALLEENAKLKTQPEKKPEAKADDGTVENQFTEYLDTAVANVLNEIIPKDSPLKPYNGDTEDLKAAKAYHLAALADKMRAVIAKSPQRPNLLNGYRRGQQNTAVYQQNLVDLFGTVVTSIDADRKTAEQMIAKTYGKQRNVQLAKDLPKPPEQPVAEPTVPVNHAPPNKIKTDREIEKDLAIGFGLG